MCPFLTSSVCDTCPSVSGSSSAVGGAARMLQRETKTTRCPICGEKFLWNNDWSMKPKQKVYFLCLAKRVKILELISASAFWSFHFFGVFVFSVLPSTLPNSAISPKSPSADLTLSEWWGGTAQHNKAGSSSGLSCWCLLLGWCQHWSSHTLWNTLSDWAGKVIYWEAVVRL